MFFACAGTAASIHRLAAVVLGLPAVGVRFWPWGIGPRPRGIGLPAVGHGPPGVGFIGPRPAVGCIG